MLKEHEDHKGRAGEIGNPRVGVPRVTSPGSWGFITGPNAALPSKMSKNNDKSSVTPVSLLGDGGDPEPVLPTSTCPRVPGGVSRRTPQNGRIWGILLVPRLQRGASAASRPSRENRWCSGKMSCWSSRLPSCDNSFWSTFAASSKGLKNWPDVGGSLSSLPDIKFLLQNKNRLMLLYAKPPRVFPQG